MKSLSLSPSLAMGTSSGNMKVHEILDGIKSIKNKERMERMEICLFCQRSVSDPRHRECSNLTEARWA